MNKLRKQVERQANAMGLSLDVEDDDNLERVAVFLDGWEQNNCEMPRGIGVYDVTVFDTPPAMTRVGTTTQRQYFKSVRNTAKEIVDEVREGAGGDDEDTLNEFVQERMDEAADQSHWVIYTHASLAAIVYSDNWLAIDQAIEDGSYDWSQSGGSLTQILTAAAYFAFRQDIEDAIDVDELIDELEEDEDDDEE